MDPRLETLCLFDDAPYLRTFTADVVAVSYLGVALDRTLFYPTGGGQPGDVGNFILADGSYAMVLGTQRDPERRSLIWHQVDCDPYRFAVGQTLQGCIDWDRRYRHMKMHTCLHLLCSIIDAPVTGCSISPDKGRLDFDLPESTLEKDAITHALNELILCDFEVLAKRMPASEYAAILEMARTKSVAPPILGDSVRVIEIPGVDIQPCGGTHVAHTGEIGRVICDKIEKKSKHNRRVVLRFAEMAAAD